MNSPSEARALTFTEIQGRLTNLRGLVYEGLLTHGPATTRELAFALQIDLLTVRPRVTELFQLGLAMMERVEGHEGLYTAVPLPDLEARLTREASEAAQTPHQTTLPLAA